jgi:hypothetical protein
VLFAFLTAFTGSKGSVFKRVHWGLRAMAMSNLKFGLLWGFGAFAAFTLILAAHEPKHEAYAGVGTNSAPAASVARAAKYECDQNESKNAVLKLGEAKIITDIDIGGLGTTGTMSVVIDDSIWSQISFERKQVIAVHMACAMTNGKNMYLLTINFLSDLSHRKLGEFSRETLTVE